MTTYEIAACPVCRSRDCRLLADREAIRHELEALWQFHLRRLRTGAPVEQLFDRAIFSQEPPLQVVQCNQCGVVYRNPREREAEVIETYQQEAPSQQALASLFDQQRAFFKPRVEKLTQVAGRRGVVLEVGSYIGGFLDAARAGGWQARGIDVNAHANEFARARGGDVVESSLDDYETKERFHAIALWNCFDQLPDPHAALQRITTLLEPKGVLALRVPNGAFYAFARGGRLGLFRAMLAWNNLASFPYRHGFTAKSLARLLQEYGYEIVQQEADALVSIASEYSRDWARWEERILKAGMRTFLPARLAPWLEVYARHTIR